MTLETFNFPYHQTETENPESGFRVQLGGSYTFTTPPSDPDQRMFTLTMSGMQFFLNSSDELDETINPTRNMYNLIKFYQRHKLYKSFHYTHPVHGLMEVKFNKPLKESAADRGGFGVIKDFAIELIEIP